MQKVRRSLCCLLSFLVIHFKECDTELQKKKIKTDDKNESEFE